jgi:hypothetical protein
MPPEPQHPRLIRQIAVVWLILGTLSAIQVVAGMKAAGMEHHWTALFLTTMAGWLPCAFAAPGILWLHRRFPLGRGRWRSLPLHLAAAVTLAVSYPSWSAALQWIFDPLGSPQSFRSSFITEMFSHFHIGIVIYAVILLVSNAIDSIHRLARQEAETARLDEELAKAQLEALRSQLEPRFLFGALHGIGELAKEGRSDEAVAMVAGLSDLLRRLLDTDCSLVPLAEEISFLESYVEILSMRFAGGLKMTAEVPHELDAALVPPLMLQPLVDHAINASGRDLRLTVRRSDDTLHVEIAGDGPAVEAATAAVLYRSEA